MFGEKLDVKVGEEVGFIPGGFGFSSPRITTVERITPTGLIVADGVTYKPDGFERATKGTRYSAKARIVKATPEVREKVDRSNTRTLLGRAHRASNFDEFPIEKIREIQAILGPLLMETAT